MNHRQIMRLARLARRPGSPKRALLLGGVVLLCLVVYGLEQLLV
jgi:hypothetical protein